jgi:phosphoserine phosphatase
MRAVVAFDCDSTLVKVEGVDELAERAGVGIQIAAMTRSAMDGDIPLEEVYGRRLEILRPGRADLVWLGLRYVETLVTGAREAVAALGAAGAEIHVVSGGLRPAVTVLAEELGVPRDRVHAVGLSFYPDGRYEGYETDSPLARAGGKAEVIRTCSRSGLTTVMIGDGMTDLEAASVGAVTVGFGGVVTRTVVKEKADHFLAGPSLEPVAALIARLTGG